MNVADFFRFIAEKKPEYPLEEWGPKIMKGTIKHLKPVPGESTIDYDNLKVTGKFEKVDQYYEEHALFNDNGKLKYSYAECDIHLHGGMSMLQSIYRTSITEFSDHDSRNILWRAFSVLSKKQLQLEKDFDFQEWDVEGGLFDVNQVKFNQHPTELFDLIRGQFSKLSEDEIRIIKEKDNLDIKRFLNDETNDFVFLEILSSASYNRKGYPQSIISLLDYVNNLFHCCAQYEADDVNSEWFDGTSPKSFDSFNNIKKVDVSRFPIVRWILSGNDFSVHYNYDKQLLSPEDVIGGYRTQQYRSKGLDYNLINHYMKTYPFQG
jgi:hypothetical protein